MKTISAKAENSRKTSYQPDLDEFLSQCELNYRLITRLVPEITEDFSVKDSPTSSLPYWSFKTDSLEVQFQITETAKYTTTMTMSIKTPTIEMARYVDLIVRLYHDAQMLEVMEGSGPSALKAIYELPNKGMKNSDEKRQINRYVGECIRACCSSSSAKTVVN